MASTGTPIAEKVFNKSIAAIPVVGSILGPVANLVEGIIGAHHAAAVVKEANTINSAVPDFVNACVEIMDQANIGVITAAQAEALLQTEKTNWYNAVSSIKKQSSPCISGCGVAGAPPNPEPLCPHPASGPFHDFCMKLFAGNTNVVTTCNEGSVCNAACVLSCNFVEPTIQNLTNVLNAGSGKVTIPGTGQNGQIRGSSAVTIDYMSPDLETAIDSILRGEATVSEEISVLEETKKGKYEVYGIGLALVIVVVLAVVSVVKSK